MFDPTTTLLDGSIDHELEHERAACWSEIGEIAAQEARGRHRSMELARQANARGDWKAAGFASHEAWYAQASSTTHHTAKLVTATGEALATLPRLDEAVSTGKLSFDQATAAVEFATPETDAELARVSVGKAPGEIARVGRTLSPPTVADDQTLYRRRALSLKWIGGGRELVLSGRLPLEQGLVVEHAIREAAKQLRATDKKTGEDTLEWQQYTADALVGLARRDGSDDAAGGTRRSKATVIVHLSEDGTPPLLEGAGPISIETAERHTCNARRLFVKPQAGDVVYSRVGRCSSYAQDRVLFRRSKHCQFPGCTSDRDLEAHHMVPVWQGGKTETGNLVLECPRHHQHIHDHGIRITGTATSPIHTDAAGRCITAGRPHAPPS